MTTESNLSGDNEELYFIYIKIQIAMVLSEKATLVKKCEKTPMKHIYAQSNS